MESQTVPLQIGTPRTSSAKTGDVHSDPEKVSPLASAPAITFPEGGLRGWLTVLGGALVLMCTFGNVQSFGVYQDYYTRVHLKNHPPSEISWIGSLQIFFLFFLGIPAGKLFDDGHFHLSLISGSIILSVSSFMLSLAKPFQYYQCFLAQGVGMGIGMGLMFLPAISVSSHYFRARRSLVMGLILAGASLSAVIHPILLNNIFKRKDGFAKGVRYASIMDLGFLVIANSIMRTRLPVRKNKMSPLRVVREVIMRDGPYLTHVAGTALIFWGLFVPFFYFQLFTALHGIPSGLVTYSISIMNVASIFGRTLPNLLSDRYGVFNVYIPFGLISALLVFALLGSSNVAGVVLFGIFYGSVYRYWASLISLHHRGEDLMSLSIRMRVGVTCTALAFTCLTGNPIAGALLSPPHYTWWRPLLFATIVLLSGVVLLAIARAGLSRRRGTQRV
ncbi:MFS general substrate transporter [Collybia nuda]|uniref:MFS general substrate transporter n=1 Tax=Collybia nuda TaxID=64659 RepID=A0A9P5YBW5_9AGAR|nr:MFS general substrate transporter [Collybia nuda]